MTPAQAAVEIGCTPQTIRQWIKEGRVTYTKKDILSSTGVPVGYQYQILRREVVRLEKFWKHKRELKEVRKKRKR